MVGGLKVAQMDWQALPEWLQEATQHLVISLEEAVQINWTCLASTQEWALLPPSLQPAGSRLDLWEKSTSPTQH